MEQYLTDIGIWHWMILGIGLAILEILAPGVIFIWLGIAAIVTGVIVYVVEGIGWEYQLLIFAALSVASVAAGRLWWVRKGTEVTDHPTLNRRGEQYVGRQYTLDESIVDGAGKMRVGDAFWKVSGADMPAGSRVRVVAADSTVLRVERVEAGPE